MSTKFLPLLLVLFLSSISFNYALAHDCIDGVDNDGDGVIDGDDADCLGSWETLASMPTARNAIAGAVLGEKIYVVGGRSSDSPQNNLKTVEVYDFSSDSWSSVADLNHGRSGTPVAAAINEEIYVAGGLSSGPGFLSIIDSVEKYDPDDNSWIHISDMPVPSYSASAAVFENKMYIIGGVGEGGVLSSVLSYDPQLDTWDSVTDLPTPRYSTASVVVGNELYVIGGGMAGAQVTDLVEIFNFTTGEWRSGARIPIEVRAQGVQVINDAIYVYGGFMGNGEYSSDVFEYDVVNDSWQSRSSMVNTRSHFAFTSVGNKVFAIGGAIWDGGTIRYNTVEAFTPSFSEGEPIEKSYDDLVGELQEKVDSEVVKKPLYQSYVAHIKNLLPFYEKLNLKAAQNQVKSLLDKFKKDVEKTDLEAGLGDELIDLGTQIEEVLEEEIGQSDGVPLITQVASPYPPESANWADDVYASSSHSYWCGTTIGECGCAISSLSMLAAHHGLETGLDGTTIDPGNLNQWLQENNGYSAAGGVIWNYALQYFSPKVGYSNLSLDHFSTSSSEIIKKYINGDQLAIGYSDTKKHFMVLTEVLDGGYGVNDPFWYGTKTTNDTKDATKHVQDYNDVIDSAKLFSFTKNLRPLPGWIEVHLGSPAELLITDSENRRTGYDPETGEILLEIPGSSYSQTEGIVSKDDLGDAHQEKVLTIQGLESSDYELDVIGTGTGDYRLSIARSSGLGQYEIDHYFEDINEEEVDEYQIEIDLVDHDSGHGNEPGCDEDNPGASESCGGN